MSDETTNSILDALTRMPEWLRRGLSASDNKERTRAEEVLAVHITNALSAVNDR